MSRTTQEMGEPDMDYRRFENKIVARIDRGEEILEQVKKIAAAEHILLADICALGATDHLPSASIA